MSGFTVEIPGAEARIGVDGAEVARYVFVDDESPAFEGPKPYLHPLRTLAGTVLTGFRPWDHRWHKGLQVTLTDVSGQNFWGGNTYVDGGYAALENVGRIRHDGFAVPPTDADADEAMIDETLTWVTQAGQEWLGETRRLGFGGLDRDEGVWRLDLSSSITNLTGADLVLGSPTTKGRPSAGYSGAFLRLARFLAGAAVTVPTPEGTDTRSGAGADAFMGSTAPWLAFSGELDEVDGGASVLAIAGTSTADVPLTWFVRSEPVPVLAPSPTFHETVTLAPGAGIGLRHRFVFADGARTPEELAALATRFAL